MSTKGGESEATWFKAAYDTLRDLDQAFECITQVKLRWSVRKGVWTVIFETWLLVDRKPVERLLVGSWEWPNSQARTFASFLFAQAQRHALDTERDIVARREGVRMFD